MRGSARSHLRSPRRPARRGPRWSGPRRRRPWPHTLGWPRRIRPKPRPRSPRGYRKFLSLSLDSGELGWLGGVGVLGGRRAVGRRLLAALCDVALAQGVVLGLREDVAAEVFLVAGRNAEAVAAVVLGAEDALEADRQSHLECFAVVDEAALHRCRHGDVAV